MLRNRLVIDWSKFLLEGKNMEYYAILQKDKASKILDNKSGIRMISIESTSLNKLNLEKGRLEEANRISSKFTT